MIFVTGSQMRALESDAIRQGADPLLLMERAAEGIAQCLFEMDSSPCALFVAGTGNNGADALAAARILVRQGGKADVFVTGEMKTAQGKANLAFLRYLGIPILDTLPEDFSAYSILVDGLFGTGFHGEASPEAAAMIDRLNRSGLPILSIDVPSGMNADTGACAVCVHADATITFHAPKTGLYLGAHPGYCGKRIIWDIGLKHDETGIEAYTPADWPGLMKKRPSDTHKADCGRVLVLAGSRGKAGAAAMCALGALKAGSGLVTVVTDEALMPILQASVPNAMCETIEDALAAMPVFDVLAAGCGFGTGPDRRSALTALLSHSRKAVLDADALTMLAQDPFPIPCPAVLTPHVGEAARLLCTDTSSVLEDLPGAAKRISERYGCTVLLKSATSVITDGNRLSLNTAGSPALSKGGSGDALCGILASTFFECGDPFEAARIAALRLGMAGEEGEKRYGVRGLLTCEMLNCLA